MDEQTCQAIHLLYEASVQRGKALDEAQRLHDLDHRVISSLHDLVLEQSKQTGLRPVRLTAS